MCDIMCSINDFSKDTDSGVWWGMREGVGAKKLITALQIQYVTCGLLTTTSLLLCEISNGLLQFIIPTYDQTNVKAIYIALRVNNAHMCDGM